MTTADHSLCPGTAAGEAIGRATRAGFPASMASASSALDGRSRPQPLAQMGSEASLLSSVPVLSNVTSKPEAMAARIAELEAQVDAVRKAVGAPPLSHRPLSVATSSPTFPHEAASGAGAGENEGVAGQPGDDGQLMIGEEAGRSTFYGSAATHYLIVSAATASLTPGKGGGGHAYRRALRRRGRVVARRRARAAPAAPRRGALARDIL